MAAARRQRRIALRALERRLINEWPELFDPVAPKPLAIGIHVAIRDATSVSGALVRQVLEEWARRAPYLAALVAQRFGLDGAPCGAVAAKQAARAAERLAQRAAAEGAKGEPRALGEPSAPSEPVANG